MAWVFLWLRPQEIPWNTHAIPPSHVQDSWEFFAQPAFDQFRGPELAPGDVVMSDSQVDESKRRQTLSEISQHYSQLQGSKFSNVTQASREEE
jgi:hypothetical protein